MYISSRGTAGSPSLRPARSTACARRRVCTAPNVSAASTHPNPDFPSESPAAAWLKRQHELVTEWMTEHNVSTHCKRALLVCKLARRAALMVPFAAAGADTSALFLLLNQGVYQFVSMYLLLLFLRVILSWFPTFDWEKQPWRAIRQVTDPYLNMFTNIVPPLLGAIDLTPLIGFLVLQTLKGYLHVYSEDDIETWW